METKKYILQLCAYAAPYEGNFIKSLFELAKKCQTVGYETIFAFPVSARYMEWCQSLGKQYKVYFLPLAKARIRYRTYAVIRKIIEENDKVHIIHSHFELYDIPAAIVARNKCRIFWHLHDPIVRASGIRSLLQMAQYKWLGDSATLISVSDKYKKVAIEIGFPQDHAHTVLNCIDTERIKKGPISLSNRRYDFLTFGWDFYRKGDDIILNACNILASQGYNFSLLINGNDSTWKELDKYLNGENPKWLSRGTPTENVSELFGESKCFIQASRRETFSYAVCEAAYAELPIICTDIDGLEWAHELKTVDFIESNNAEKLANVMKSYLDGKQFNLTDYNQTKRIINENYSINIWSRKIIELYEIL